jgi:hypothetical protein
MDEIVCGPEGYVDMKRPNLRALSVTLAVVVAGLLSGSIGQARESPAQDAEKSLGIERYPDQPLELIDLKVGVQRMNDRIATKSILNGIAVDTITFKERDGWFKHVLIRFRNVSGRPIYGVTAYLYFQPPDARTLYSLPLAASTALNEGVVQPGAEVILTVTDQAWSLTADILEKHKVNPDLVSVKFAIGMVRFSDDLRWSQGHLLRQDPNNPYKWNVIDTKVAP